MTMDARKQRVLQAIVALYGLEGEPVGSSVLANYFDIAVSSATLRNEMAEGNPLFEGDRRIAFAHVPGTCPDVECLGKRRERDIRECVRCLLPLLS